MKQLILAITILGLAILACGAPALITPGDYVDKFGGNISIYVRILSMTDCTELEKEFEQADENANLQEASKQEHQWSIGYRTAAENRMKEVGCSGDL